MLAVILAGGSNASAQAPQRLPVGPQGPLQQPQRNAGAPGAPQAPPAGPPFQLTADEQALVDQVLELWEIEGNKIKNYKCSFERWEYDCVFGPGQDVPKIKSKGLLKYSKPDKGLFRVTEIRHYTPAKEPGQSPTWETAKDEYGDYWVCDGEAVYEYNFVKKQLIVRYLPEEMRGKAIADGPLPFLFGAKKDRLKARYWIRVSRTTPKEIWLAVYPRWPQDKANYDHVDVILDREKFLPAAVQITIQNGNRTVYMLSDAKVNDALENFLPDIFKQPHTPPFWTKVVEEPPSDPRQAVRSRVPQPEQATPLNRQY